MSARTTKTTRFPRTDQTANPAQKTTSFRSKAHSFKNGFTLIEILIVISIIAAVIAIGLPAVQRVTSQRINSTTRKFVGLIRTIRNDAVLLNNIYRLAIDFEHRTYWVEMQREQKLLADPAAPAEKPRKKGEEPPPSNFLMAPKYTKRPADMPTGVEFDSVLKEKEGLIRGGIAYVHFFPSGFNEQAILYLKKEGAKTISYSLLIRPTSGKVEIFPHQIASFDSADK